MFLSFLYPHFLDIFFALICLGAQSWVLRTAFGENGGSLFFFWLDSFGLTWDMGDLFCIALGGLESLMIWDGRTTLG